ncbi:selenocysteine insertion sequence-binding protein 2 [Limosa lapponica baueri]|uniref:Selenocysteine insertion sequence-binding protein 2 n=1 Tax=Limosa lapponica baueri TaxID=1758121 RepID=A0A2I0U7N7_LIMLA|nr:selenocysteine insertion sequence-binding protein 2 [Limosa lapponica baueri]
MSAERRLSPGRGGEEDTSVESKASSTTLDETVASLIPTSFDGRDGSTQPHVSWSMVLSQPPKKIVSSPASEGLSRGKGKQDSKAKDAEEFPDLAAASDRRNRLGSQKSSFTPAVRKQTEIHLPKEPLDSRSCAVDGTPKVDGLLGKQASSSILERKKMQETSRSTGKKSQIPVQLDLGGMLAVLEQKQQTEKSKQSSKPVVFSGGLDETLHNIIDCACEQNIPFVFALNRKTLGRCVNKAVPVSVVGIFSYDGAQDHFHRMVQLTTEARKAYKDMIAALEEEAEGELRETQSNILTTKYEKNGLSETGKTSSKDSDEDVPNYIKIWKRKLEEEYNPYALELEKSATADMVIVNSEEHQ